MKKLDIFGLGIEALSTTITAQRRVNCYYDFRQDNENNPIVIVQSPGLTRYVTLPSSPIRGMYRNYVLAGSNLYYIQNQGFTFLGSIGSDPDNVNWLKMYQNLTQLTIVDGNDVHVFPINSLAALLTVPGQIITQLAPLQQLVGTI